MLRYSPSTSPHVRDSWPSARIRSSRRRRVIVAIGVGERSLWLARSRINGESPRMRHALIALLAACGGSQIAEHHPTDTTKFLPATLEATRPHEGDPRTVK